MASDSPAELQRTLTRVGNALGADIGLYAANGALLASSGTAPPLDNDRYTMGQWRYSDDVNVFPLQDGRLLVADLNTFWQDGDRSKLGYLVLIAAVIGAAAYPVVRHLTRRLEALRAGVDKFGGGALDARVAVHGKDEVAAVAASFNQAAARIEQLVGAHRALLANASHELRSPLTRLRMAVDMYGAPAEDRHGKEILTNLGEIDELVDEILLASRLDHIGRLERSERLDLTALVAEECARHGVEATGERAEVRGDPRLLRRLARNLLANAARHGRPPIEVDIRVERSTVRLEVRDHGDGLPAGEEKRIFEPFYRPPGRAEAAGGWGLGLSLVKQIAELHGGEVRYRTPAGGGACFVVELPRFRG